MKRLMCVWAALVVGLPGVRADESVPAPERTPAMEAVERLGSFNYREREEASRVLWSLGEVAVEELTEAADSSDPEVSWRARILLDRIRTGIGPGTPEQIVELVQRYRASTPTQKINVLERLRKQGAFAQIIRLYHFEEDENVRRACADSVNGVVLPAVTRLLYDDDWDGAVALLRVSPDSHDKYRRLAALYRTMGILEDEIARLRGEESVESRSLLLACLAARGDLDAALSLARKLDRDDVVAALSVIAGDPVPYMDWFLSTPDLGPKVRLHVEICSERWHGREQEARNLLRPMLIEAREEGDDDGMVARSLFLNGYLTEGLNLLSRDPDVGAALEVYYDGIDAPEVILEMYGFPEEDGARREWLQKHAEAVSTHWDFYSEEAGNYLGVVKLFLERGELEEAYGMLKPLADAAQQAGPDQWTDFLTGLGVRSGDLLELGFRFVRDNAGEEDATFVEVCSLMVGWDAEFDNFSSRMRTIWDALAAGEETPPGELVMAVGKVLGAVHAPPAELEVLWNRLLAAAGEARNPLQFYQTLLLPASMRSDSAALTGVLELMLREPEGEVWIPLLIEQHAYRHEWEKAEALWQEFFKDHPERVEAINMRADRVALLIRLGRVEEAEELLARRYLLSLDEPTELAHLAQAFESAGLWDRAADYWRRLLMTTLPYDGNWHDAVGHFQRDAKLKARWAQAAALAQVDVVGSQIVETLRVAAYSPWYGLRKNFALSFFRGLDLLARGRVDEGKALIERGVDPILGDGVLADDFFPILREEGHVELHDHYFEKSYARMLKSLALFPDAHNTHNSAAWLASRACRRLDEAEEHATKALAMRPRQAAYLDTMAEVWFARHNREKAVEWSYKSMRDAQYGGHTREGGGAELRAQHDRFLTGEFPVK